MQCRHCETPLSLTVLDLAHAPPSNAYLEKEQLRQPEVHFPLRLFLCESCGLVQTEDFCAADQLFDENYVYFSSTSSSWCAHAARFADSAIDRFGLSSASFVVEVASNDGYLLQNFVNVGIPCLGFEPTASTAEIAARKGVDSRLAFFGETEARALRDERKRGADLIIGNNVYAHVPAINDFTRGLEQLLADQGVISLEFPHLLELVEQSQFDTVYHEHFSYLSLTTVQQIFAAANLRIFDVEQLSTHGGSLRVWGCRTPADHATTAAVDAILDQERAVGITTGAFFFRPTGSGGPGSRSAALLPAGPQGKRRNRRRLWRCGKGDNPAQLCPHQRTAAAICLRCGALQTGALPAGLSCPGATSHCSLQQPAATFADPALEHQG
jgi:hypothetical protein